MSTFSGGYGPEEEDGAGWDALAPTKAELRAEARQAALEKDAARYRWLRDVGSLTWISFRSAWRMDAAQCDAAIDHEIDRQIMRRASEST